MKKKVREILGRMTEIRTRLNAIADLCEAEKREMNDAEKEEHGALMREAAVLNVRLQAEGMPTVSGAGVSREAGFDNWMKHIARERRTEEVVMAREAMVVTDAEAMVPLTISDIIGPLEEGLILKTVGIKLQTGLAGDYVSPVVGKIEASFADEAAALTDSEIPVSKLKPTPKRVGVTVSVSSQLINQTQGVALDVVKQQIPMAVTRTLNKVMFSPTEVNTTVQGPFAVIKKADATGQLLSALTTKAKKKACSHLKFAGAVPTYKELLAMKGIVLAKGVINDGTAAYVMDEYMKATLESTPRDEGSGLMIVEDGRIAGIPVFCTNEIDEEESDHIGFGIWSYELLGQFGEQRFVVDPVSGAKNDVTILTLNGDWSMTTARAEAFVLGTPTTA
ncbi:MAG TPA: phage major capsid protein [Candidatus Alistipes merdipullorum]|nr:phage major capsid protein [Candidatus Alistipes merdipullorum]